MTALATFFTGICTLFAAFVVFVLTHSTETRRRSDLRVISVCTEMLQCIAAGRVILNHDMDEATWIAGDPRLVDDDDLTNEWQYEARARGTEKLIDCQTIAYANRLDELVPMIVAATDIHFDVYEQMGEIERLARTFIEQNGQSARDLTSEQFNERYGGHHAVKAMLRAEEVARSYCDDFIAVVGELSRRIARIQRVKVEAVDLPWWERLASGVDRRVDDVRRTPIPPKVHKIVSDRIEFDESVWN